jgi:hypothetical protein
VPKVVEEAPGPCPNCGCEKLFLIEVAVEHERLIGGKGTGVYGGCAACPYASPMMTRTA